jgi:hypothetical protein
MDMRRRLCLAVFAAVVAALAIAVVAQASGQSRAAVEKRAIRIYNSAAGRVAAIKHCQRRPPQSTVTHDRPSDELLATFGVLRRPATSDDAVKAGQLQFLPAQDVYIDYVRTAHAASGRSYMIVAARNALSFEPQPADCIHRLHVLLRRALRGESRRVKRRALHFYNRTARNNKRLARRLPREGIFVFGRSASGDLLGGGGGAPTSYIREHGSFTSSGASNARAALDGLIPDGVATISSTFARVHSRGPGRRPRVYPRVITRSDPVQDNIVSFTVARSAEDAFPSKMIWRDADGRVVRVVRDHN